MAVFDGEAFIARFNSVWDALEVPDLRFKEIRHFISPEFAVVESVTTGTPHGGTSYETHLVDLLTIRDGKIAAKRSYRKARL